MLRNQKEFVKRFYHVGDVVELVHMDDAQAPPVGTRGEVMFVDDIGQIHVRWENGSTLALIYGEDRFKVVERKGE